MMAVVCGTDVRRRFQEAVKQRIPEHVGRRRWSAERIAAHQQQHLRHLLAHAIEHSPFHARRLVGVDPPRFDLAQLQTLPVMTKAEMMASFDEVVTARRVTRDYVETHLAATGSTPLLFEGQHFAVHSGGSSGLKGVFVYGWDAMVEYVTQFVSHVPSRSSTDALASVGAPGAAHPSGLGMSLIGELLDLTQIAATSPLPEIVRRLNECQPDALFVYPSVLRRLAREQRAGRLSIRPARIRTGAERLEPDVEAEAAAAFEASIVDSFASSEGLLGFRPPGRQAFTFASDLAIVEPVDEHFNPVPVGVPSAAALVTNLFNHAQPLIRYVLEDRFTQLPAEGDPGHLVARVDGRASQEFIYGARRIHPLTVLAPLFDLRELLDYQVRQTPGGVDVDLVVGDTFEPGRLEAGLTRALTLAGLPHPHVTVRRVEELTRDSESGKLRRVVPLSAAQRNSAVTARY